MAPSQWALPPLGGGADASGQAWMDYMLGGPGSGGPIGADSAGLGLGLGPEHMGMNMSMGEGRFAGSETSSSVPAHALQPHAPLGDQLRSPQFSRARGFSGRLTNPEPQPDKLSKQQEFKRALDEQVRLKHQRKEYEQAEIRAYEARLTEGSQLGRGRAGAPLQAPPSARGDGGAGPLVPRLGVLATGGLSHIQQAGLHQLAGTGMPNWQTGGQQMQQTHQMQQLQHPIAEARPLDSGRIHTRFSFDRALPEVQEQITEKQRKQAEARAVLEAQLEDNRRRKEEKQRREREEERLENERLERERKELRASFDREKGRPNPAAAASVAAANAAAAAERERERERAKNGNGNGGSQHGSSAATNGVSDAWTQAAREAAAARERNKHHNLNLSAPVALALALTDRDRERNNESQFGSPTHHASTLGTQERHEPIGEGLGRFNDRLQQQIDQQMQMLQQAQQQAQHVQQAQLQHAQQQQQQQQYERRLPAGFGRSTQPSDAIVPYQASGQLAHARAAGELNDRSRLSQLREELFGEYDNLRRQIRRQEDTLFELRSEVTRIKALNEKLSRQQHFARPHVPMQVQMQLPPPQQLRLQQARTNPRDRAALRCASLFVSPTQGGGDEIDALLAASVVPGVSLTARSDSTQPPAPASQPSGYVQTQQVVPPFRLPLGGMQGSVLADVDPAASTAELDRILHDFIA
jgi:hypothetical protein